MQRIEFEKWEPSPENPNMLQYMDQRAAQEVFEELRHRLQSTGYLPDEYFRMDTMWENREIPKDADVYCTADYGESEGVYLDVYLTWYEDNQSITERFITGKTLGDNDTDLDRMFLVSSAIIKAFHGEHATHSRYTRQDDGSEDTGDGVFHLNQTEQRLLIDSLIASRNQMIEQVVGVDQLLRRMTGSITEYVNETGHRPLQISDYDMAVLAIQDGNLEAFKNVYSHVPEQHEALLVEAAGRPGVVGRKMTLLLLNDFNGFSYHAYVSACKKAVDTGDTDRVLFLAEQGERCVKDLSPALYGVMIEHAFPEKGYLAYKLVEQCTSEQIAAAPPYVLYKAAIYGDENLCRALVKKGVNANRYAAEVIKSLYEKRGPWAVRRLLDSGMHIDKQNYSALRACIQTGQLEAGKLLLDQGMDFDRYQAWADKQEICDNNDTTAALAKHWESLQNLREQDDTPKPDGPILG